MLHWATGECTATKSREKTEEKLELSHSGHMRESRDSSVPVTTNTKWPPFRVQKSELRREMGKKEPKQLSDSKTDWNVHHSLL